MEHVNIAQIINWPQAIVAIVLILVLLVWPGIMAWIQAKRSAVAVNKVHETMTNPNGGDSVKDALNRIEQRQEDQGLALAGLGERMTAVEDQITRPPG